jgi:hypothetical protein
MKQIFEIEHDFAVSFSPETLERILRRQAMGVKIYVTEITEQDAVLRRKGER